MSIFTEINRRITENMERHRHFLVNPHAEDEHKIEEAVELLMPLVQDDSREDVKRQIVALIHENMK